MTIAAQLTVALTIALLGSVAVGAGKRGVHAKTKSRMIGYFWGNRGLESNDVAQLLLSTSFSLNGTLYQVFLGYQIGPAALWIQFIWCISYYLLSRKAERVAALSADGTLHGIIGKRFGPTAEKSAAIASLIGFALQVGWELAVFAALYGILASANGQIPTALAIVVTLAVSFSVAAYTMIGGIRGNLKANQIQNAVAILAFLTLIVFAIVGGSTSLRGPSSALGGGQSHTLLLSTLGLGGLLTNIVFSLAWQFVDMSTWQSIAAGKPQTSRASLVKSSVWVFFFPGVAGTLLGMFLRGISGLTSDNIVPYVIEIVQVAWPLAVIVLIGLICAMLSTLDGLLLALAQAYTWDLRFNAKVEAVLQYWRDRDARAGQSDDPAEPAEDDIADTQYEVIDTIEKSILRVTRRTVFIGAVCGALFVLWLRIQARIGLFDLVYMVVVSQMVLLPTVLSVLYGWRTKGSGAFSIAIGWLVGASASAIGIAYRNSELQSWAAMLGLIVATIVLLPLPHFRGPQE